MSADTTGATDAIATAAAIRVSGSPSAEELAALVVVLSALGDGEAAPEHARSAWSDPSYRLVGPSARHGGWRSTGLPR
ncbi:acyl-CoA carboxylase subunit epsilon [Terrabacter sp. C0L_2]|uniref:acyl-CoA carboxylase subunit epsilon n=1 Tax=Terrabacter sp. C0L_2 TaxID=3108389 RepID=UPI002ED1B92F|nr:acyl-CoA carboxylase subunit epsilon [Terrabacter sp. C0L_2]